MNNELIYNAVLAGISGSTQNLRQGVSRAADYTSYADRAAVLALAVDALIAPAAITEAEAQMMGQIVAGIDLQRCFVGKTPAYATIAADILTMWNEFKGRISPTGGSLTLYAADFAAARALGPILAHANEVNIACHTTPAGGGGGSFDVYPKGAYVDNDGTRIVIGNYALIRRGVDEKNLKLEDFGVSLVNDGTVDNTVKINTVLALLLNKGGTVTGSGNHLISGSINVPYGVTLRGLNSVNANYAPALAFVLTKAAGMNVPGVVLNTSSELQCAVVTGKKNGAIFLDSSDGVLLNGNNGRCVNVFVYQNGQDGIRVGTDAGGGNYNNWYLENCSSSYNARDGFHFADRPNVADDNCDASAGTAVNCLSQFNTGHGFYSKKANLNTFIGCSPEGNMGYGWAFYERTRVCSVLGGDPEANAAGDVYIHPAAEDIRMDVPYLNRWKNFPNGDVGVYVYSDRMAFANAAPTRISSFVAAPGKRCSIKMDVNTSIEHNATIKCAGNIPITGQDGNSIVVFENVAGIWREISRNFSLNTTNLLFPSSDLTSASWVKTATTAPAITSLKASAGVSAHNAVIATTAVLLHQTQLHALLAAGTYNYVRVQIGGAYVNLDLTAHVVAAAVGCTATFISTGDGYYLLSLYYAALGGDQNVTVHITDAAYNLVWNAVGTETITFLRARVYQT